MSKSAHNTTANDESNGGDPSTHYEIINRITTTTIIPKSDLMRPEGIEESEFLKTAKQKMLVEVYGNMMGSEADKNTYGPFTRFFGNFEAVHFGTGIIYGASICIVPSTLDALMIAVLQGKNVNESGHLPSHQVSYDVHARFSASIGIRYVEIKEVGDRGYEWVIQPLEGLDVIGASDDMKLMRDQARKRHLTHKS